MRLQARPTSWMRLRIGSSDLYGACLASSAKGGRQMITCAPETEYRPDACGITKASPCVICISGALANVIDHEPLRTSAIAKP